MVNYIFNPDPSGDVNFCFSGFVLAGGVNCAVPASGTEYCIPSGSLDLDNRFIFTY